MKTETKRVCIYPKDIQRITGKSYRQSTRLFLKIKNILNKSENQFLSVSEFCMISGLDPKEVESHIK